MPDPIRISRPALPVWAKPLAVAALFLVVGGAAVDQALSSSRHLTFGGAAAACALFAVFCVGSAIARADDAIARK